MSDAMIFQLLRIGPIDDFLVGLQNLCGLSPLMSGRSRPRFCDSHPTTEKSLNSWQYQLQPPLTSAATESNTITIST